MLSFFYPKLALANLHKNRKTYIPFLLAAIGVILMFYNMSFLTVVKDIGYLSERESLRTILSLGRYVIAVFAVIFLFYTNSFLIKGRKKEFGLFNILGMEKKHLIKVMFFETLFTALLSIGIGIPVGILFSKLTLLLLFKIVFFPAIFGFEIPLSAVLWTLALFAGIFLLNLFYNVLQVYFAKPVELLKGGNVGEKEPKTRWILALVGGISLGAGYYIALTTQSPLVAMNRFFIAVILVIIGTYSLFTAGSVAFLKMLRSNKGYYYKPEHFISLSSMIYSMKRNAVGLANICILSTIVLIMVSSTVALYVGEEDALHKQFPRNMVVDALEATDEQVKVINEVVKQQTTKLNLAPQNVFHYRSANFFTNQQGNELTPADITSFSADDVFLMVMSLAEYNRIENQSRVLAADEVLLFTLDRDTPGERLDLNGYELAVKERLTALQLGGNQEMLVQTIFLVVKDLDGINRISQAMASMVNGGGEGQLSYSLSFDVGGGKDEQLGLMTELRKEFERLGLKASVDGIENQRDEFYAMYGGLFFLGLFLGLLFIMATVLIIYYKQIAEGYEDRGRFGILQQVGMGWDEVKKTIRSQVLTVFFLPLVAAAIHVAFSFKFITRLLMILKLTNTSLFAVTTVITLLVFALFYGIVYALTARTYYQIVR